MPNKKPINLEKPTDIPLYPRLTDTGQNSIPLFMVIGAIFGVSFGFDAILKEKKEGTLKQILSTPLYRDEFIIGKVIGAVTTLAIAFASILILTIAILLFYSIIPDIEDLIRIAMYFIAIVLYCTLFYAIAMMVSLIVKNSAVSIMFSMCIILALFVISMLSPAIANSISSLIIGPAPVQAPPVIDNAQIFNGINVDNTMTPTITPEDAAYFEQSASYQTKLESISEAITSISPINNFIGNFGATPHGVAVMILSRQKYEFHNYI